MPPVRSSGIANGYAYVKASAGLCRSSCLMRLRPRPHPQSGECVHGSAPLLPLAPVVACPAPPAVRVTLTATAVTTERRRRFMATSGSCECNVVPEERRRYEVFFVRHPSSGAGGIHDNRGGHCAARVGLRANG